MPERPEGLYRGAHRGENAVGAATPPGLEDRPPEDYVHEGRGDYYSNTPRIDYRYGGYTDWGTVHDQSERIQMAAEQAWLDLLRNTPLRGELTPTYSYEQLSDELGSLIRDDLAITEDSEGMEAMRQAIAGMTGTAGDLQGQARSFQELADRGGYTDADTQMSRALRNQQAQALGSANRAALQQMQARGTGGGGAELAARMGGSQAMANANAMNDAQIQQAAMQRALQAMQGATGAYQAAGGVQQGAGQLGAGLNQASAQRQSAIDEFNQQNMGFRRGTAQSNVGIANAQQDANVRGVAGQNEAERFAIAGMTGQQGAASTLAQQKSQFQQQQDADLRNAIIGAVGTAATGFAQACCHPDTWIDTPDGRKRISDIRTGDLVLSVHKGTVRAVPVATTQRIAVSDHKVQKIRFENGTLLRLSPNHPAADGYAIGDFGNRDLVGGHRIAVTELVPYLEPATYDIRPDSDTGTYFSEGIHLGSTIGPGRVK